MRQSLTEAMWQAFWVGFWNVIARFVLLVLVLQMIKCMPA